MGKVLRTDKENSFVRNSKETNQIFTLFWSIKESSLIETNRLITVSVHYLRYGLLFFFFWNGFYAIFFGKAPRSERPFFFRFFLLFRASFFCVLLGRRRRTGGFIFVCYFGRCRLFTFLRIFVFNFCDNGFGLWYGNGTGFGNGGCGFLKK